MMTVWAAPAADRSAARTPQATGSASAASGAASPAGRGTRLVVTIAAGTRRYSAKVPVKYVMFGHNPWRPATHHSQPPHGAELAKATASPSATVRTPSPTAATV